MRFLTACLAFTLIAALPARAQDEGEGETYSEDEVTGAFADFFGVTAESAASVIEKLFADQGRPVAYITGTEGAGAFGVGLRYGAGWMETKSGERVRVYWRGPSVGPRAWSTIAAWRRAG